jgi:hypothetical protein
VTDAPHEMGWGWFIDAHLALLDEIGIGKFSDSDCKAMLRVILLARRHQVAAGAPAPAEVRQFAAAVLGAERQQPVAPAEPPAPVDPVEALERPHEEIVELPTPAPEPDLPSPRPPTVSELVAGAEGANAAAIRSAASELGRRGGLKGGAQRAANMTPAARSEASRQAAAARWQAPAPSAPAPATPPAAKPVPAPRPAPPQTETSGRHLTEKPQPADFQQIEQWAAQRGMTFTGDNLDEINARCAKIGRPPFELKHGPAWRA